MKYPKLPPKFKAKWVAALRSGKFKQGHGRLFSDREHCCLGVASRLCGVSNRAMARSYLPAHIGDAYRAKVPKELLSGALPTRLANLNDGINTKRKTFPQIADWIEKNL